VLPSSYVIVTYRFLRMALHEKYQHSLQQLFPAS